MQYIQSVSRWIEILYSVPRLLILIVFSAGFLWLFNFSSLPLSNPALLALGGNEGLLDLRNFYSAQEAYAAFGAYGEVGREIYLNFLTADFLFIPIYSFGFAFLLTLLLRKLASEESLWLGLNVLPLGIALFDCIEDSAILTLLTIYPDAVPAVATLAGMATLCKQALLALTLLLLAAGVVLLLLRYFRGLSENT